MPFLDFGFGTGLAYRHDWEAQNRFLLGAAELNMRKEDRDYLRNKDLRESQEAKASEKSKMITSKTITGDPYNTARAYEATKGKLTRIGEIMDMPGYNTNPELKAEADRLRMEVENDPIYLEAQQAKESYERAKKAHDSGMISYREFKEAENKYSEYVNTPYTPGETPRTYNYEHNPDLLDERLRNHLEGIPDIEYDSSDERSLIIELQSTPQLSESLDESWELLPEQAKKDYFNNDKNEWIKTKVRRLVNDKKTKQATTPKSNETAAERTKREKITRAQQGYVTQIRDRESGTDKYVGNLMDVDEDGVITSDVVYYKTTDAQGNEKYVVFDDFENVVITTQPTRAREWFTIPDSTDSASIGTKVVKNRVYITTKGLGHTEVDKTKIAGITVDKKDVFVQEDPIAELVKEGKITPVNTYQTEDGRTVYVVDLAIPIKEDPDKLLKWYEGTSSEAAVTETIRNTDETEQFE